MCECLFEWVNNVRSPLGFSGLDKIPVQVQAVYHLINQMKQLSDDFIWFLKMFVLEEIVCNMCEQSEMVHLSNFASWWGWKAGTCSLPREAFGGALRRSGGSRMRRRRWVFGVEGSEVRSRDYASITGTN